MSDDLPTAMAQSGQYVKCDACKSYAHKDRLEDPQSTQPDAAFGLAEKLGARPIEPFAVMLDRSLQSTLQSLAPREIPRTEKLMTAIASSGWNGRYVEEVGVTFAARTLVAFVRAIEHELDHVPAPRLECGHVADGLMCDVTCSKGYRGE